MNTPNTSASEALARWVLDRAMRNPSPGREEWARAMAAEFEALPDGRLSWAIGCWAANQGWRAGGEALFWACLILIPCEFSSLMLRTLYALDDALAAQGLRTNGFGLFLMLINSPFGAAAVTLAFSAAFGAWRPRRDMAIALATGLAPPLVETATLFIALGLPLNEPWTLYHAPPAIALTGLTAVGLLGAWIGARMSRRRPISARA